MYLSAIVWISVFSLVASDLVVYQLPQTVYDTSPELRIWGYGFNNFGNLTVNVSSSDRQLSAGQHYTLTKDSEGRELILKLCSGQR